jgi:disulfide bond formation protein DsbB
MKIGVTLNGAVTDLSHDDAGGRFLVTTDRNGVYVLDGGLGSVLRHTVVDAGFSVDLGTFAGAAFLDGDTVMALGQNKSYVVLKEKDGADARANFRYFLESFDRFDEVTRGRFATVRARLNYVMSLAFDPQTASLYTLAVPNRRHPRIVVSRFDRKDLTLSEEYLPRLAGGLVLGEKRSLDEYHVTGAAVASGRLYALSAAYGTLLVLDLAAREVVSAYALEGATAPSGLALRGEELLVASADGTVSVYGRP